MALSSDLLSQFAKTVTSDDSNKKAETTVTGTAVEYNGKIYVCLDGSDQLTPIISSTAGMKNGDRVTVMIKNHSATVTGNVSDPSATQGSLDDTKTEIGNKITEVEILIADKVDTIEFNAEKARIDQLTADNVNIKERLTATEADIGTLEADNVTIKGDLDAANADIDQLETSKLDASVAAITYAEIKDLEATNANIHNLEADYGSFKQTTTDDLTAINGTIDNLDTTYAKIDFANIGSAAVEALFTKSGIIENLVVSEGHITGKLVGVTIVGDLIEGGTVKADKLVVQGSDGLYYKLNVSGETVAAEQTEYNSLNGSIITAQSITAEKISVDDLVAFDATIGGFHITEDELYSGNKNAVDAPVRGTYMNDDGEFSIGDQTSYLKFYKDADNTYKLAISASALSFSSSGTTQTIQEFVSSEVVSNIEMINNVGENMFHNSELDINVDGWDVENEDVISFVRYKEQACLKFDLTTEGTYHLLQEVLDLVPGETYSMSGLVLVENYATTQLSPIVGFCSGVEIPVESEPETPSEGEGTGSNDSGDSSDTDDSGTSQQSETITIDVPDKTDANSYHQFPTLNTSTAGGEWERVEWTFVFGGNETATDVPKTGGVFLQGFTGQVYLGKLKLEKGDEATSWTENPEDLESNLINMIKDVNENFSSSIDNLSGIVEGNQNEILDLTGTITENEQRITNLEQTAEGWTFNFNTITETITELGDTVTTNIGEQLKYIKFIDGEIWLGRDPDEGEDDFKVVISNERIRFLQNGIEVAYISNNQLHITNARVTNRLDLGNFSFYPRENGNLTLRYVEGGDS